MCKQECLPVQSQSAVDITGENAVLVHIIPIYILRFLTFLLLILLLWYYILLPKAEQSSQSAGGEPSS